MFSCGLRERLNCWSLPLKWFTFQFKILQPALSCSKLAVLSLKVSANFWGLCNEILKAKENLPCGAILMCFSLRNPTYLKTICPRLNSKLQFKNFYVHTCHPQMPCSSEGTRVFHQNRNTRSLLHTPCRVKKRKTRTLWLTRVVSVE